MKRILLVSAISALAFGISYSQLSLRPHVGINFPKLTEEIEQGELEGNVGYQFGVNLMLGEGFYFQPGLNFQTAGFTLDNTGDLKVSTINLPVMVGFELLGEGSDIVNLRLFGGPNFAIHVNESLGEAFSFITKENIKNSEISGIVGAGVDVAFAFLDVGYKFGFTDFFEDLNSDAMKNMWVVNVGLRLGS